jgi:hypothetical protein
MIRTALIAAMLMLSMSAIAEDSFYSEPALFSTRPDESKSLQSIDRFGPVGMGINLVQPAFTMQIKNVEEGSPAEATGKLRPGQYIETINGQRLADIDPRIQLADILSDAEATDGLIRLMIQDAPDAETEEIVITIPVLGAYTETWPLNDPKSDRIVRGYADYLAQQVWTGGIGLDGMEMLFLLSTGEEQDLDVVREWVKTTVDKFNATHSVSHYAWFIGYGGVPLTEYYLRTGDESILPVLQALADTAKETQYLDGWAGRGGVAHVTYGGGGGHLNAGGTAVVTFLMLAKECGVDVDEQTLQSALAHFYRFAGRGNNPYGDNKPEVGFVDNGKNGNLAFAMAAAASLTPDGEESVYAAARDVCAVSSFYSTTFMLHGHTGGGIGETWRSAAMGLLYDKTPTKYREFMDNRQWIYELSRRYDGSFGIVGGARYDTVDWGAGFALTYTFPRKTLRISGAPKTPFVHEHQLPERPWGTKADDVFLSIEAAVDQGIACYDLSTETLANDSSRPTLIRLTESGEVPEDVLRRYAHHQDHSIRLTAARKAMGINSNYLGWKTAGGEKRPKLMLELIRSQDPRVRRAAIEAMSIGLPSDQPESFLTPEVFDLLMDILSDPEESWWVKDAALNLVGRAPADWIAPYVDIIVPYLRHKEWWLQHAALTALTPVVADERCYQSVLPAIGELLRTNDRYNATAGPMYGIRAKVSEGSSAVQSLASESLEHAYEEYTGVRTAPGGQNITTVFDSQMKFLAESLAGIPGGYDLLYEIAKTRFPNDPLPYAPLFLSADPEQFGPELREAIEPIIREKLIYEYIGKNRLRLLADTESPKQNSYPVGLIDGLTDLYRKVDVTDYDWHIFGPDLKIAAWDYYIFDPPEEQAYDVSPWRYREVTYPMGMENWFMPDFDAQRAGWGTGRSPFGQNNGRLVTDSPPCSNPNCAHANPMGTFWDKEVLLMRKTFELPPLKPGHLYRVRVGAGQHVGIGDGYKIYINGQELIETTVGVGRRQGARPRGAYITNDFLDEFDGNEVTIAATSFLRYGDRAIVTMPPVPQGIFSLWLEEMKRPPLDAEAMRRSATMVPMTSSLWQATQDPDNADLQTDEDLFRFDGQFVPNPMILGDWRIVDQVALIDEFNLEKAMSPGRPVFSNITFKELGETNDMLRIWSGDVLMALTRNQALQMTVRQIGGDDYLFIEAGGFRADHPVGWQSPWYVMKRYAN